MNFISQNLVYVYYNGLVNKKLIGRLLLKSMQIFFEYDINFIKTDLELSPFKLPLKPGVILSNDRTFEGLFGLFNDSLPDGWGKLLLDRKLMNAGLNPGILSPLDRLCFVGNNGIRALSYEPKNPSSTPSLYADLNKINDEIQITFEEDNTYIDKLFILNGSSSGIRPKVLLYIDNEHWLIKFRSSFDFKDISAVEYAYHLMAIEAGLYLPKARLFSSKNGLGFFGTKRFDRESKKRIHSHTI